MFIWKFEIKKFWVPLNPISSNFSPSPITNPSRMGMGFRFSSLWEKNLKNSWEKRDESLFNDSNINIKLLYFMRSDNGMTFNDWKIETLGFGIPNSLPFALSLHYSYSTNVWQMVYFYLICRYIKIKFNKTNDFISNASLIFRTQAWSRMSSEKILNQKKEKCNFSVVR